MRLTTKLFLSTATLVTLGTAAVGASTVAVNYSSEVKTLASAINRDASQIDVTSYDALGDALAVGQESEVPISIAFVSSGGLVTLIHDDGPNLSESQALDLLEANRKDVFEYGDLLVRTLRLETGGDLVLVSSLATIKQNLNKNLVALGLVYVAVLLVMLTLTWLALRRDMRSIKRLNAAATAIAKGDLEASIPRKTGNSEIAELARSLDSMVDRLQGAINTERDSKRSIESFIGDASHELRTPLTVIRGYSELLKGGKADEKFRQAALEKIVGEVDRMSRLVEDLLLLARIGQKPDVEKTLVNVEDIALTAAENLSILGPKRKVTHRLDQVTLETDKDLLTQFFANAISNIHRYVPTSLEAAISVSKSAKSVIIKIEDAGPGLTSEIYKAGVSGFQRFDPKHSKTSGGTGLGMNIMGSIAEHLGGKVALSKSKSLGGLCITLTLPR